MADRSSPAKTGNQTVIAIAAPHNVFTGKIISASGVNRSREALSWSDLSTTNQEVVIPTDLYTVDPLEIEWRWDPFEYGASGGNNFAVFSDTSANMTITFPMWSGNATGSEAYVIGSGFFVGDGLSSVMNNEVTTGTLSWQYDGVVNIGIYAEDTA